MPVGVNRTTPLPNLREKKGFKINALFLVDQIKKAVVTPLCYIKPCYV